MSRLPQRRKSAEEIAKLRESLGIPGAAGEEDSSAAASAEPRSFAPPALSGASGSPPELDPVPASIASLESTDKTPDASPVESTPVLSPVPHGKDTSDTAAPESSAVPLAPIPVLEPPETFDPHEPHAFNERHVHHEADPATPSARSAAIPVLPVEDAPALHERIEAAAAGEGAAQPLPIGKMPRVVKSLRKSEQGPISEPAPPPKDSPLPAHRHSDREIAEIRRHEILAQQQAPMTNPLTMIAHPVLFVPGYLFALAGALCFLYYDFEITYTAVCVLLALFVAAFIFFKKPLSRHHAAFISVTVLFVIVFGMLHYFPALGFKYGT